MNGHTAVALVGMAFCALGAAALCWAWLRRQLRADETAGFALRADEPEYAHTVSQSPWGRRLTMAAMLATFTTILLSPLVTVIAAMSSAKSHPAAMSSAKAQPHDAIPSNREREAQAGTGAQKPHEGGGPIADDQSKCPFGFGK